jgi:RAB protein geranylgeranyltransferase component A
MTDDSPRDEEGLLAKYDVVVCGTGLVPSILASALARAGKSILHCDAKGYYGELDAVLSLPFVQHGEVWNLPEEEESKNNTSPDRLKIATPHLTLHSTDTLTSVQLKIDTPVTTPYGSGIVKELPNGEANKLVISLDTWTLADGVSPTLYIGIPDEFEGELETYLAEKCQIQSTLLIQAEKLLQQSSRSFAIDVTPSLIFGSGPAVLGFIMSNVSDYVEFKSIEGMLWLDNKGKLSRVPCSKGDVFGTKLLNPLEKRKLMKFLQLVMDYATSLQAAEEEEVSAEEEVQSVNERQLNQGRSLSRPQNKAVKTGDLETLKAAVEANEMDFETYLTETQKLPASLKSLVRHALALETTTSSVSIGDGMRRLCHHLQGLGKFGTTAFLAPLYGSGEFPQAFCRSAAVHGATYLLRREPKFVETADGRVTGVVISGLDDESEDKTVACDHVIVPPTVSQKKPSHHILRRVSVVNQKIIQDVKEERHIMLIPPNSSLNNDNAIHGIAFDSSVKVVPPNCTLLHLTTTVQDVTEHSVLENAAKALLPEGAVELYHVSFSYPLYDDEPPSESPVGLHVCKQTGQTLAADDAFVIAKEMFDQICPDLEFLQLSEKMDNTIKENLAGREEEDEERDVLDKAAGMLQSTDEKESSQATDAATEEQNPMVATPVADNKV